METTIIQFKLYEPRNVEESQLNTLILALHEVRNIYDYSVKNIYDNREEYNKYLETIGNIVNDLKKIKEE